MLWLPPPPGADFAWMWCICKYGTLHTPSSDKVGAYHNSFHCKELMGKVYIWEFSAPHSSLSSSAAKKSSDRKRKIKFVLPKRTKSALNRPPVYCRAGTFLILLESAVLLRKYHGESCFLSSNSLSLDHLISVTLQILLLLPERLT